jgi:hypothetical protein
VASQRACAFATQAGADRWRAVACRGLICADLLTRTTLLLDYGRRRLAFLPSERELQADHEE